VRFVVCLLITVFKTYAILTVSVTGHTKFEIGQYLKKLWAYEIWWFASYGSSPGVCI